MNKRVPTSNQAAAESAPQSHGPLTKGARSRVSVETPKGPSAVPTANLNAEAQLWSGVDTDRSLELATKDVENRLAELASSEEAASEASGEVSPEAYAPKRPNKAQPHKATARASHRPLGQVSNALSGFGKDDRPPDAFALLKEAKEAGVLFVEDALHDGHTEDDEDPLLAAAVEECIRLCFGVRGILRIGPGRNDQQQPIVVLVATYGLTGASLERLPSKVRGFSTLVAIPFELLPLKRER